MERAQRDELAAFVEQYLNLRDRLARDTDDWDEVGKSGFQLSDSVARTLALALAIGALRT
jgi:hypothetical protein